MFIISQYLLNLSGTCKNINQTSTYSIITGLILYASIYLYLLFYNDEYLSIFNKFLIYIIVVDLLLSTFYYFNLQKSFKYDSINIEEYKSRQEEQDNIESVDMSLVDDNSDISDTQSEEQYEQEETEQELQEETEQETEQPEYSEHLLKQEHQLEEQPQEEPQLNLDLDEIDTLLSIPVLEEQPEEVEPIKVKVKRQPRKKKESVVI